MSFWPTTGAAWIRRQNLSLLNIFMLHRDNFFKGLNAVWIGSITMSISRWHSYTSNNVSSFGTVWLSTKAQTCKYLKSSTIDFGSVTLLVGLTSQSVQSREVAVIIVNNKLEVTSANSSKVTLLAAQRLFKDILETVSNRYLENFC